MTALRRPSLWIALVACTSLARAGVLVVDAGGAGNFTDLPPAVAAAVDGDVLLVKGGSYSGFLVQDKALDVVADAGAVVSVTSSVRVAALSATRTVTLTGLNVVGAMGTDALAIVGCSGAVRVQGCSVRATRGADCDGNYSARSGVYVENSQDVGIVRCDVHGAEGHEQADRSVHGGPAVMSSGSRCALYESTLTGGRGGAFTALCPFFPCSYGYAGVGGFGLSNDQSPLAFASGCTIRGGMGGDHPCGVESGCGGVGWLTSSLPAGAVARRLGTLVQGGVPGGPFSICGTAPAQPFGGVPPTVLVGIARTLTAPRVLREGSDLRVDVTGVPGESVALVIAERAGFQYSDGWRGVRLTRHERAPSPVMRLGTTDASGVLHATIPIPDLGPGVASVRLFLQTVHAGNGTGPYLGPLETVVLLDSAY